MSAHPNMMTAWPEIRCQRGCPAHVTRPVRVRLGGPTGYSDLPSIPARLAREFDLVVWDPERHPVDGGPYCPSADAVSETIVGLGVWEPVETIVVLDILSRRDLPGTFLNVGSQLGWFSVLALTCGRQVVAVECDADNARVLETNLQATIGVMSAVTRYEFPAGVVHRARIGVDPSPPLPEHAALAVVDVEGAEPEVVDWLWPLIESGRLGALLVEVSPVFHDRYREMCLRLHVAGMRAYALPEKSYPPRPLAETEGTLLSGLRLLEPVEVLAAFVAEARQVNMLFVRGDVR